MLDSFLKVAYEANEKATARSELVELFKELPEAELHKIARGELKLASGDECWLDKFKGSQLYDEALALEEQMLHMDIEYEQRSRQERAGRNAQSDHRDGLNLKRRLLELKLHQAEHDMGGEVGAEEPPALPPEAAPVQAAPSPVEEMAAKNAATKIAAMKTAARQLVAPQRRAAEAFSDELGEALTPAEAKGMIGKSVQDWEAAAAHSAAHPTKSRLGGAAILAPAGAFLGAAGGIPFGRPGMGALVGGGLGGVGGAILGSPARKARTARELQQHAQTLSDPEVLQAAHQYGQKLKIAAMKNEGALILRAHPEVAVADAAGRVLASGLDKQAFAGMVPALKAGVIGVGKHLGGAGKTVATAYQKGGGGMAGLRAAGSKVPGVITQGAQQAGQFATQNPAAAAALGGAALGGAGLVGYGAHKALS